MEFTWDEPENRVKQRKHGISFGTAVCVFDDPYHLTRQDREVDGEPRWQTIGMVNGAHVLLVAHTVSEEEEVVHIISARKATRQERASMRKATKNGKVKGRSGRALTLKQKRELKALAALPDRQIDTSDIPELSPSAWKDAVRGRFYRPVKQAVSMRLDADVVAWLKRRGRGYQTRANGILRQSMLGDIK